MLLARHAERRQTGKPEGSRSSTRQTEGAEGCRHCVVQIATQLRGRIRLEYKGVNLHGMAQQFVSSESAMKPKIKAVQLALQCRYGRETILAHGMCATCYTLRRQDEEHFGGLREMVLDRDDYRCRVCDAPGTGKRSLIVHHRVPGRSELKLMISLCPGCHARVHRTKAVLAAMPPLLLVLWRGQHPKGHEQRALNFAETAGTE